MKPTILYLIVACLLAALSFVLIMKLAKYTVIFYVSCGLIVAAGFMLYFSLIEFIAYCQEQSDEDDQS